jgi:hydrogenase maturation protease
LQRGLRALAPRGVEIATHEGAPLGLLDRWQEARLVVLIDATASRSPPGTIHRFDARAAGVPEAGFRCSTHALGLADAIALARALGKLPPSLIVYGLEGADFEAGEGVCPAVAGAVDEVAERVLRDVAARCAWRRRADGYPVPRSGG